MNSKFLYIKKSKKLKQISIMLIKETVGPINIDNGMTEIKIKK